MTQLKTGWEIQSLGAATLPSPIPSVKFTTDDDVLLLNPTVSSASGSPVAGSSASDNSTLAVLEKAGPRQSIFFKPENVVAGIVTCGGLCPALNNVIRSIVNTLTYRYGASRVIGFKFGYEGLNPDLSSIIELTPHSVRDIHQFGGTILGSSRGPQPIGVMVDYMVKLGVNMLFTIGGDGTQRGAMAIAEEVVRRNLNISVIGVPKTIDNDICYVERTFGFETAVALAQEAIKAGHEEARSARNGLGIVKLMGRESGFIALHASLASGDVNMLLLPETKFTMDSIVSEVLDRFEKRSHCMIVISEGAGQELCQTGNLGKDASGNSVFADVGVFLKKELSKRLNALNVEHTIKYIDPSYTIRAAVAVPSDAIFALQLGQMAVHAAMAGKTSLIVGMMHNHFVHIPMTRAVEYRKKVDIHGQTFQSFLDASGMPISLVHQ
ncbi:diphosphate--fructose-6-phosphate 1-phosphotransferase [Entophlyctis helioformis]|nr:diphosphate--fructose-6-phosphate 1-phosphotransferase [Entophlyctis helioformis]